MGNFFWGKSWWGLALIPNCYDPTRCLSLLEKGLQDYGSSGYKDLEELGPEEGHIGKIEHREEEEVVPALARVLRFRFQFLHPPSIRLAPL